MSLLWDGVTDAALSLTDLTWPFRFRLGTLGWLVSINLLFDRSDRRGQVPVAHPPIIRGRLS